MILDTYASKCIVCCTFIQASMFILIPAAMSDQVVLHFLSIFCLPTKS